MSLSEAKLSQIRAEAAAGRPISVEDVQLLLAELDRLRHEANCRSQQAEYDAGCYMGR